MLEILCMSIFTKNGQLWLFCTNLPKTGFWGRNFEYVIPNSESAPPRYYVCQFSAKMVSFDFFDPNLPKNEFWGRNFKSLSTDLESVSPRYYVCQFSGKTDNFEFFDLNLGKLPNYVQYFGSYNFEPVAESWGESEMSWVEWMELGESGRTF